ncbi:MAG: sulfite exporter TauE/SafE family protein [Phycisphaeraceae bacterium]
MTDSTIITTYIALLLAALAGSLHCVGMCGPILIAFSNTIDASNSSSSSSQRTGISWRFLWYHVGRIWTYGMLGLLAGYVGCCMRHGSSLMGWQQSLGIAAGTVVVLVGLALLGVIPGVRLDKFGACGLKKVWTMPLLRGLLKHRGATSRVLLGALMGLLPCGLVYSMLAIVATLPTPMHAALGMIIFGVGTVPSLTAALMTSHLIPVRWRSAGTRLAAIMIIATGVIMAARSTIIICNGHGT